MTERLKLKEWEKIYNENTHEEKAGVAMLKLGEVGFQTRNITGDKNGHYLRIKRSIHQEGVTYKGL